MVYYIEFPGRIRIFPSETRYFCSLPLATWLLSEPDVTLTEGWKAEGASEAVIQASNTQIIAKSTHTYKQIGKLGPISAFCTNVFVLCFFRIFTRFVHRRWFRNGDGVQNTFVKGGNYEESIV